MKKRTAFNAKKISVLALMTALGLIMFMIESMFPPLFFPGAKMGLSNIFSLLTLILYGLPEALLVAAARTVLGSLFAGNASLLLYSLTAGIVSVCVSRLLLFAFPKISILCVSIVSAVVHNCVQLFVYFLQTQTPLIFSELPYLVLLGVLAGVIVGITVIVTVKAIPLSVFERVAGEKEKNQTNQMEESN